MRDVSDLSPADGNHASDHPVRWHSIRILGFITVAAGVLAWQNWTRGRYEPIKLRVAGPSMVPTLLGPHYAATCPRCDRHEIAIDASTDEKLPSVVPCFLCGGPLSIDAETVLPGDLVMVQPMGDDQAIDVGQLIAIESSEGAGWRVKRVAAVSGQTVDVAQGQLSVDGRRIEDELFARDPARSARMKVSDAALRAAAGLPSRWSTSEPDDSAWQSENGVWVSGRAGDSSWLVYHHQNVHENRSASPVTDDYEYNASLMRRLDPVDRLYITAKVNAEHPCWVEIAFWTPDHQNADQRQLPMRINVTNCSVRGSDNCEAVAAFSLGCKPQGLPEYASRAPEANAGVMKVMKRRKGKDMIYPTTMLRSLQARALTRTQAVVHRQHCSGTGSLRSSTYAAINERTRPTATILAIPVTRESPVAIRVVTQPNSESSESVSVRLEQLTVWKSVQYRLRRNDDRSQYPLQLGQGEFFVVGDNVPVSIDSRDHGPIRREQLIGVVTPPVKLPE